MSSLPPSSLPSPKDPDKLIFAPAGSKPHGRAAQFLHGKLHRASLDPESPIEQFHNWFREAQDSQGSHRVPHPETCTLSTAELPSGRVSSRVVYLKELDSRGGFVIYTNMGTSRKANDLNTNPHAALVFWWEALQRQVRIEGVASRVPKEQSQTYFDTRLRSSRISAWASRQSKKLDPVEGVRGDDGRARLDEWVTEAEEKFEGDEHVPVPEFWGGLRIVPERIEFWQGRENRLHDRFVYERVEEGVEDDRVKDEGFGERAESESKWTLSRLSP